MRISWENNGNGRWTWSYYSGQKDKKDYYKRNLEFFKEELEAVNKEIGAAIEYKIIEEIKSLETPCGIAPLDKSISKQECTWVIANFESWYGSYL